MASVEEQKMIERDAVKSSLLECVDDCSTDAQCKKKCYLNDCKRFCKDGEPSKIADCETKCDTIPFEQKTGN